MEFMTLTGTMTPYIDIVYMAYYKDANNVSRYWGEGR